MRCFVGHAYQLYPHVLYAHAHNLAYYVGKGRQQASIRYTIECTARCRCSMRGMYS